MLYCMPDGLDRIMSNPLLRTPFGTVELRPVASPAGAPAAMRAYVLLPDLDELLGVPGFGLRDPILVRVSHERSAATDPTLRFH
jgi:hypothetical protein